MPAQATLQLVVGLGNPGERYAATRHNAGFWYADRLAARAGAVFRREARFEGELAELHHAGRRVRLFKPQTFMNHSGRAVQSLARYFDIAVQDILVAHDELDLPPGTVRIKRGGGHGGHNGLRDLVSALGADFWRLRFGVGHPGHKDQVIDYVLHRAGAIEQAAIDAALGRALEHSDLILDGALERAMHGLHTPAQDGSTNGV